MVVMKKKRVSSFSAIHVLFLVFLCEICFFRSQTFKYATFCGEIRNLIPFATTNMLFFIKEVKHVTFRNARRNKVY